MGKDFAAILHGMVGYALRPGERNVTDHEIARRLAAELRKEGDLLIETQYDFGDIVITVVRNEPLPEGEPGA